MTSLRTIRRHLMVSGLVVGLSIVVSPTVFAGNGSGIISTTVSSEGNTTHASERDVSQLQGGRDLSGKTYSTPMVFAVRLMCPTAQIGEQNPGACVSAVMGCLVNGQAQGVGMLYEILARPAGSTQPWQPIGTTCFADHVPGTGPVLSIGQILDAFHTTPWASARINTQPAGNTTLVALPTFFMIDWSTEGYQPGEIDTLDPARMLGLRVQIRPAVDHYTYVFGDGTTFGPTPSTGGPWPGGDITHAYPKPGSYHTRVDTTFTGQFRVNDGPWTQIPDTITIPGPPTTVTVKTAHAVLVH